MKAYAIIGAVVIFGIVIRTVVVWIETGAVSRFEATQAAHALQVKNESLADVRDLSERARSEQAEDLTRAQVRIDTLEGQAAELREKAARSAAAAEAAAAMVAGEETEQATPGELCKIGCTPRWNTRPQ